MKVGLIDVDGHNFPNLALMKISSYHKQKGDYVEFYDNFQYYDKVYVSKVFDFTQDFEYNINAKEVVKGGTGYDLKIKLPEEIEKAYPDYSLYNIDNVAYGYLTRGCPRKCEFCIVSEKEGKSSYKVNDLSNFWRGQKEIKLLDANLLACKERLGLLKQLVNSKAYVDFTQGLDIRLTNSEINELLKQIKVKQIHFAWDSKEDEKLILDKLKSFKVETNYNYNKLAVYVLTNFNTTFDYDVYRVSKLKELGFNPYIMIYNKENCNIKYKWLQRYVNNRIIFRSKETQTFDDYLRFNNLKII